MRKDEKFVGYVSKVHNLVYLMKDYGEVIIDNMIVDKVRKTLTFHFDHVIMDI